MLLQETALNLKCDDIYWVNLDPTVGSEIKKNKGPVFSIGATPINDAGEPSKGGKLKTGLSRKNRRGSALCANISETLSTQ